MPKSYIYKITNIISRKVYIGKSNTPDIRKTKHFSVAKTGYNKNNQQQYIHRAINKYGKENFIFEIIEECENEKIAYAHEPIWIKKYNSDNREYGYNLTKGGEGGCSPETALKISKTTTGRILNLPGLLKRLFKLFCLLPGYRENMKKQIKESRETKRAEEAFNIITNYFNVNKPNYDIFNINKKSTNNLKQDIINLYSNDKVLIKDIASYMFLRPQRIIKIIAKYKKNGTVEMPPRKIIKGRKLSTEHKQKISKSSIGKKHTQETKQKVSMANGGEKNGMFGKTASPEARQKQSDFQSTRIRKPLTNEHKEKLKAAKSIQDMSYRIPIDLKQEIITLYKTNQYTKKQLAQQFGLKFNTVVKILRKKH